MDILLLILLAVGFVTGLVSGAVRQVISLVAFVTGFVIACLYYYQLGELLIQIVPVAMPTFCRVVAFLLLWIVMPILAQIVSAVLTSMLDSLMALGLLNRLLGGILGLAKYALVLGTLIWFFSSVNLIQEKTMQESRLCKPLKAVPEYIYNNIIKHPHRSRSTTYAVEASILCRRSSQPMPREPQSYRL